MATQSVACAFDLNDDGIVKPTVELCGRNDGIVEDVAPFCNAPI